MPNLPLASVLDSLGDLTSLAVAAAAFLVLFALVELLDRV
jgi:hypothetical protein